MNARRDTSGVALNSWELAGFTLGLLRIFVRRTACHEGLYERRDHAPGAALEFSEPASMTSSSSSRHSGLSRRCSMSTALASWKPFS